MSMGGMGKNPYDVNAYGFCSSGPPGGLGGPGPAGPSPGPLELRKVA